MNRVDGTSARQLDLDLVPELDPGIDETDEISRPYRPARLEPPRAALRLLRRDVYAELARRRRRAQIAARHELDRA